MKIRSKGEKVFQVFNYIALTLLGLIFVVPYALILAGSLTSEAAFLRDGYSLWPSEWSFEAYKTVFAAGSDIMQALKSSLIITIGGTAIQVTVTTMMAYGLSRRNLKGSKFVMGMLIFAMLFSGGLIPSYLWIAGKLQLRNNYLAVLLPGALNIWNCILTINYFRTIPVELEEAAKIDGCGSWRMFFNIMLPMAIPIIATITLFAAVQYWNMWAEPALYFDGNHRYMLPLTALLREIIQEDISPSGGGVRGVSETVKMATTVLATLPIICVYPFLQKYFMSGLTLGAVKG